jgi:hypothetical protein
MVWMPSRLSRVLVLTGLRRVCVVQVKPAHGAHGPVVECPEHPHHLRSQAPVLSTKHQEEKGVCLLFISSKVHRCARRALRCSPGSSCRARGRGLGSRWVAQACMGGASPCVCCKPVAEGGAGEDLRMLRGARKRSIIWARGPGEDSPALTHLNCLM